jgi:hypothetical protein
MPPQDVPRFVPEDFNIMGGGPFNTLAGRFGLLSPSGTLHVWRLTLCMWMPFAVIPAVRYLLGWSLDPLVFDISVHTRFLVSLPLLVLAGHLIDGQARAAMTQLYNGDFADRRDLDLLFDRARRLRHNGWVEGAFMVLALIGGQATLWGLLGPTGIFHGVEVAGTTLLRSYYAAIALPLLQFMTLRWLWRWGVWSYVLLAISRMPLKTIATHPDRCTGLGFISATITGFAVFEMAISSLLAGAWGTQLLEGRVTVPSLLPTLLLFVLVATALACAPLFPFTTHLYRMKRKTLLHYNPLTLEYVRQFHRKWVERKTASDEDLLGTPDIQSLADIGNAYKVILDTRTFVFSKKKLAEIWIAAVVPMVPLIVTVVPVNELFKRIGGALVGGLFG